MRGLEGAIMAILNERMRTRKVTIFMTCEPTGDLAAVRDHMTKWMGTTFASLLDSAGEWVILKYKVDRTSQKCVVEV